MSPALLLLTLTIMKTLPNTCAVGLLKKSLNAPCRIISSPDSEHDNNIEDSYEGEDDEQELDSWTLHDHMYKRSITDQYHEPEDDCEEANQLKCINGTCQVHCNPETQVMDSSRQKCLGKAGFPCGRNGRNRSLCVPNASCTLSYCECDKGYGNQNDFCITSAKYKESCGVDRPCDKKGAMECINGTCECSFGSKNQWYDPHRMACLSYAEGKCTTDTLCTNNSLCSKTDNNIRIVPIEKLPPYTNKRCQCKKGYILSSNSRTCLPSNGTSCHNSPCHENFKCVDGMCLCHNPSYEAFDETKNQCLSLVGKPCDSSVSCVNNAECVGGKCDCQNGYSSGENGKCYLDFGQPCEYVRTSRFSTDRQSISKLCNAFRQLACVHKVCDCLDSIHVYNNITKNCVLPQNQFLTFNEQEDEQIREDIFKTAQPQKSSASTQPAHSYSMFQIFLCVFVIHYFPNVNIFLLG